MRYDRSLSRLQYYTIGILATSAISAILNFELFIFKNDDLLNEILILFLQTLWNFLAYIATFQIAKGSFKSLGLIFILNFLFSSTHFIYALIYPGDFNFGLAILSGFFPILGPLAVYTLRKNYAL